MTQEHRGENAVQRPPPLDDDNDDEEDEDLLVLGDDDADSLGGYGRSPKDAFDFMGRVSSQVYRLSTLSNVASYRRRMSLNDDSFEAAEESFLDDRTEMEETFLKCCMPNQECDLKLLDLLGDGDTQVCEDYQRIMEYFAHKKLLMDRRKHIVGMKGAASAIDEDSALKELSEDYHGLAAGTKTKKRVNIMDTKKTDSDDEALKSADKLRVSKRSSGVGLRKSMDELESRSPRTSRRGLTSGLSQRHVAEGSLSSGTDAASRLGKSIAMRAGAQAVFGFAQKKCKDPSGLSPQNGSAVAAEKGTGQPQQLHKQAMDKPVLPRSASTRRKPTSAARGKV